MIILNNPASGEELAWFCLEEKCMIECSNKSKERDFEEWKRKMAFICATAEKEMQRKEALEKRYSNQNRRSWMDD